MWTRMTLRALGLAVAALALEVGCSHAAAAQYQPNISMARLSQVPPGELGDVHAQQAQLDGARATAHRAWMAYRQADRAVKVAKADENLAKSQLEQQKQISKMSTQPIQPGAEQRAAREQAAPETYPPVSKLYGAQLKLDAAKAKVKYLQKYRDYAKARADVAGRLVGYNQAKLDEAVFDTLERVRPQEAAGMKHRAPWFASKVASRQADLENARADMDQEHAQEMQKFDAWRAANDKLPPADQLAPPPDPGTLPAL